MDNRIWTSPFSAFDVSLADKAIREQHAEGIQTEHGVLRSEGGSWFLDGQRIASGRAVGMLRSEAHKRLLDARDARYAQLREGQAIPSDQGDLTLATMDGLDFWRLGGIITTAMIGLQVLKDRAMADVRG